ncbi:MutS-related protein [Chryseolinea soli]|uniref:DNA mismatch repair protein n=1 Tax=Chryseolinea soli TaxID=2321403 RepID=A0A385SNP1_9BACT|nr:DNA mismatch repair protein [Chryseolinea soli]AYB31971.1 DNA mismatch repair protein [Chryseolinea soli]
MGLMVDKQTLEDLTLVGKYKINSVYSIFRKVKTTGGEKLLDKLFSQPLDDADAINMRARLFQYFQEKDISFPFAPANVQIAEDYVGLGLNTSKLGNLLSWVIRRMQGLFLRDDLYQEFRKKQRITILILEQLLYVINHLDYGNKSQYRNRIEEVKDILGRSELKKVLEKAPSADGPFYEFVTYDYLLRGAMHQKAEQLLMCIHELDVYIAVSGVARERKFSYASAHPSDQITLHAVNLRHPSLNKGVPNTISLRRDKNMIFLTGANMAGKSTLMKSIGISIYLGHIGFPVAAESMAFSVMDGLYTSINVSDNLNLGYSHFYAEVLRVKHAAEQVGAGKNMVVIFDELFKGTNVKDAYDATLEVTRAFSEYDNCFFVISTHIVEVGDALREQPNIQFLFLPTMLKEEVPQYSYRLETGISSDRHGMTIIRKEGILDIIRRAEDG